MARPRTWNDKQLSAAVEQAKTWNDVVKGIGRRPSARATSSVQGHCLRLGLKIDHLPAIPEDVRPAEEDWTARAERLAEAVAASQSWAQVMRHLEHENSGSAHYAAKRLAAAMGVDTTHLAEPWNRRALAPETDLPFSAEPDDSRLHAAAIGEAISWFMRRGYMVSLPVEPTRYDLIAESDEGLKKVQVKSTTRRPGDIWMARIGRMEYGRRTNFGANGSRGRTSYSPEEVDLFFIVTGGEDRYLIPIEITGSITELSLDRKYAAYRV